MQLRDLLATQAEVFASVEAQARAKHPALQQEVKGLCTNSQMCGPGDLFMGMPGTRVDGGEIWEGAIAAGAISAIVSPSALQNRPVGADSDALVIPVENMSRTCAEIAAAFYDYPARALKMVGVTGTNGKTTTTHLIDHLLRETLPTALLGTLYTRWPGHQVTALHTTPFAADLQSTLAAAHQAGCTTAVMEVSSHALDQQRVWGCPFEVAVFTNLTQDHLDYHPTMEDYFQAKALLFGTDYLTGRAVINGEDDYGQRLLASLPAERAWRYGVSDATADLYTSELTYGADGVNGQLHTPFGTSPFTLPLVGQFNLANMLAAVGAVLHLGLPLETVVAHLATFGGVPGRMERVRVSTTQDISVIVDYAHTPDSLKNALVAARPFVSGQLHCVFGGGGDRDRTKRPQMGHIAYDLADAVVVTSDNPRTEDPDQILADVVAGIPAQLGADQVICDRAEAIQQAIATAQPGDGVLIAGKGHEDYQIIGTEKIHFDDREQARLALAQRLGEAI
ncbi:MAG: UDP-N-acetylmuramoyl-L-alanyl-D-glutamate--2,6-diaminopimelate ligase [Leptolyngbyaceae cyanobacterium]